MLSSPPGTLALAMLRCDMCAANGRLQPGLQVASRTRTLQRLMRNGPCSPAACTAPCPCLHPASRHASIPSSDFEFDRVLGPAASQSDVYHAAVKPIVEDVLNG